jgi:preprotein translocase SecE subunit
MAVAVKNASEATPHSPLDRLAVSSLLGVLYVLGSIGVLFYGIPRLWWSVISPSATAALGEFVDVALLGVVMLGGIVGLVWVGGRLVGPRPPHGLKAGIGLGVLGVLAIALVTWLVGTLLESSVLSGEGARVPGMLVTAAVGLGLLVGAGRYFFRPQFEETLINVEDQGWFSATTYKKNQGVRVRRGTILGILVMAGAGLYQLHNSLKFGANDLALTVPFSGGQQFVLFGDVRFTLPITLAVLSIWLGWRAVNFPTFADFLIATEAEMNKVSWTTRRRLVQDTIVVLVTVILMTVFLFVVDMAWSKLLSNPYVGVIRIESEDQKPKQAEQEQQPW